MSNLGAYQTLTTAAKAAGGVEPYVAQLERAAALRAAPGWLLLGAGLGAVGVKVKQWNDRRLERARRGLRGEPDEV